MIAIINNNCKWRKINDIIVVVFKVFPEEWNNFIFAFIISVEQSGNSLYLLIFIKLLKRNIANGMYKMQLITAHIQTKKE